MREIIFRGKRIDNGEFVYGSALPHDNGWCTIFRQNPGTGALERFEVELATVGQYTGLTDKNSKKIFEGDIVKDEKQNIGHICFLQQEMGYVVVYQKYDTCLSYKLGNRNRNSLYECDSNLEIIGNIFDNPELIKE